MAKSREAFRTISEVAEWLDTPAHVLRFWESKFSQIKPVKRAGGRRYYRPTDMALIGGIKQLLHVEGMTIKGAQKVLREQGVKHVASLSPPLEDAVDSEAAPAPAAEPATPDPRVVPFQARTAEPVAPPADPVEPEEAVETETPDPEETLAAVLEDTPTPEPEAPSVAPTPEPTESTAPEPEAAEETQTVERDDEPALPGFLRASTTAPSAPVAEESAPTEPEPEPAPAPAPAHVSVPDDPEDAAVSADPGLLSAALRLNSLDATQAEAAAEVIAQLRGLRDRMAAQR